MFSMCCLSLPQLYLHVPVFTVHFNNKKGISQNKCYQIKYYFSILDIQNDILNKIATVKHICEEYQRPSDEVGVRKNVVR